MIIFGKNKALEAQLTSLAAAVRKALNIPDSTELSEESLSSALATLLAAPQAERDNLSTQVAALTTARDSALADVATLTTGRDDAQVELTGLTTVVRAELGITDPQATLTQASIASAIEAKVGARAVDLAASQGVPPVRTQASLAGNSGSNDEVESAFETARAETDPRKRAKAFRKASRLCESKAGSASN